VRERGHTRVDEKHQDALSTKSHGYRKDNTHQNVDKEQKNMLYCLTQQIQLTPGDSPERYSSSHLAPSLLIGHTRNMEAQKLFFVYCRTRGICCRAIYTLTSLSQYFDHSRNQFDSCAMHHHTTVGMKSDTPGVRAQTSSEASARTYPVTYIHIHLTHVHIHTCKYISY